MDDQTKDVICAILDRLELYQGDYFLLDLIIFAEVSFPHQP